jgi:hypothetical protein
LPVGEHSSALDVEESFVKTVPLPAVSREGLTADGVTCPIRCDVSTGPLGRW